MRLSGRHLLVLWALSGGVVGLVVLTDVPDYWIVAGPLALALADLLRISVPRILDGEPDPEPARDASSQTESAPEVSRPSSAEQSERTEPESRVPKRISRLDMGLPDEVAGDEAREDSPPSPSGEIQWSSTASKPAPKGGVHRRLRKGGAPLSQAQFELISLLAKSPRGVTVSQVAAHLEVSPKVARWHLKRVLRMLQVRNARDASGPAREVIQSHAPSSSKGRRARG